MAANTEFSTRSRRIRTSDRLRDVLLWIIVLIWFLPAFWIILTSIRARAEVDSLPPVWIPRALSFDSYKIIFGMPTPEGVANVEKKQRRRNPSPPFTTSTLQQEAARKLGFGAQRTMRLAQRLYEGVDFGEGPVGLIT